MPVTTMTEADPTAPIRVNLGAILILLELRKSTRLVTALAPSSEKMSRYDVVGGDLAGMFGCFAALHQKRRQIVSQTLSMSEISREGGL